MDYINTLPFIIQCALFREYCQECEISPADEYFEIFACSRLSDLSEAPDLKNSSIYRTAKALFGGTDETKT